VFRITGHQGKSYADVVFQRDGERILETYPSDMLAPMADILERFEHGESDQPRDFFLKQLAWQIPLENSGGELSNSKTDLLPHQILLTHQVVSAHRRRFHVADEVGLGKTIEVGMILRELVARGEARRILVICPAGLTVNWQNEMRDCFRIFFDILGQDFTDANPYAWERRNHVIVSIDTIKKRERLDKLMTKPDWDIIVFDEAHHLSRKRYGKKIDVTQNYRLAEKIKGTTRNLLFLTATPHQGDPYQFWSLIQLLDDQLFDTPEAMQDHRGLLGRVMFRRIKKEVTDAQGDPIFMRRQVHTQKFQLSLREQRFYEKLTEYLKEGYNAAGAGQDKTTKQQRAVGFVMATFQKIMSSSPRAIKQALRRRLIALYARRQMAREASEALRQLTQDLHAFNLEYYRELKGRFTLEDLRCFTEKAALRLGGSFIPSGDIINISVPPALKKYPDVASSYTNVTFSRKLATRKKGVDLLGLGHPFIDALVDYFRSEAISGDVLLARCTGMSATVAARYLFTIDFEDGSRRERYEALVIDGHDPAADLSGLSGKGGETGLTNPAKNIEDKLRILVQNQDAKIRSISEGVVNVRALRRDSGGKLTA